jgi:aspartate racemase
MSYHIGIVACSAEGAALCYRTICLEAAEFMGRHTHPEVSLHTHPLARYMEHVEAGEWEGVADLMLASAEKLAKAGADFLICPDNTIHQAFDLVVHRSPRPWLHIAQEVAVEAKRRGFRRLGIMGTWYLTASQVYPSRLEEAGIEYQLPRTRQRERMNQIIFEELVEGIFKDESLDFFLEVIDMFKDQKCDAVVLGCTEIPLLVKPEGAPLPVLDSTRILARAALRRAVRVQHSAVTP